MIDIVKVYDRDLSFLMSVLIIRIKFLPLMFNMLILDEKCYNALSQQPIASYYIFYFNNASPFNKYASKFFKSAFKTSSFRVRAFFYFSNESSAIPMINNEPTLF